MSIFDHSDLTAEEFLQSYWQQRPCVLRHGFAQFTPALDADDVAGLACDEMAESRLINGSFGQQGWSLRHGPFSEIELSKLPETHWTLLVQDVEKHYPPLAELLTAFRFVPSWRLDDLMISVSAPGGSVGPHYDQYDVFLLQASGRRCWQVAEHFDPRCEEDCDLNVLQSFHPEQEWVLEPGDILYVPPGVAHHGVALDMGMTWSIGMRAPSQADLLQSLGEWLAETAGEGDRFRDGVLAAEPRPGEINRTAIQGMQRLLQQAASSSPSLDGFIGSFLTRYRLAHQPAPPDIELTPSQLKSAIEENAQLQINPWTRLAWIETNGAAQLFAAGETYSCPIHLAVGICSRPPTCAPADLDDPASLTLICRLINQGHLFLSHE